MSYSYFKLVNYLLYHIKLCFFSFSAWSKTCLGNYGNLHCDIWRKIFFTLTHDFFQSLKYLPTVSSSLTPLSEAVGKPQHKLTINRKDFACSTITFPASDDTQSSWWDCGNNHGTATQKRTSGAKYHCIYCTAPHLYIGTLLFSTPSEVVGPNLCMQCSNNNRE